MASEKALKWNKAKGTPRQLVRVAGEGREQGKGEAEFVVMPDYNEPWGSLAFILRPTGRRP